MSETVRESTSLMGSIRKFPVLYGLAWALFWAVVGTIFIGLWAHFGNLSPTKVVVAVYSTHGFAIVVGAITASRLGGSRGWFYGGITGFVYSLLMIAVGFVVYNTFLLDSPGILRVCLLTLVGAFSGMIGVNLRRND